MNCIHCGQVLPENSAFCDKCGAAQRPIPPAKNRKKWPIIALCILLAVVIAAGSLALLLPGKETVYVFSGYRCYSSEGTLKTRVHDLSYDALGNPMEHVMMSRSIQSGFIYSGITPWEMEYDERGNVTVFLDHEFSYTYGSRDRIETCTQYYQGEETCTWTYTWDSKGNLTQVVSDQKYMGSGGILRGDFVYNDDNLLVCEYLWGPTVVQVYEYKYDDQGNVTRVSLGHMSIEDYTMELSDVDVSCNSLMYLEYNEDGQAAEVEYLLGGNRTPHWEDGTWGTLELKYDRKGNLKAGDVGSFEYDEHGNLTEIAFSGGIVIKLEYEAVELTAQAAQRYERWAQIQCLDLASMFVGVGRASMCVNHPGRESLFFYYLVPNPIL